MQSCLDRKWAKAAACYGRDKKEAAVVEDRAALQDSARCLRSDVEQSRRGTDRSTCE